MKNIEKYEKEISQLVNEGNSFSCSIAIAAGISNGSCFRCKCSDCQKKCLDWMYQEYKEPILDDVEKEYLSAVIKPFRKKISYIRKSKDPRKGKNYIKIEFCDGDSMFFPNLSNDEMYKGMKLDRKYTLEELGL